MPDKRRSRGATLARKLYLRRIPQEQIAAAAGVDRSVVSRTIHGAAVVHPMTRAKVLRAIDALLTERDGGAA
jgi:transcriptional regulator with XRE-family HTH domain